MVACVERKMYAIGQLHESTFCLTESEIYSRFFLTFSEDEHESNMETNDYQSSSKDNIEKTVEMMDLVSYM